MTWLGYHEYQSVLTPVVNRGGALQSAFTLISFPGPSLQPPPDSHRRNFYLEGSLSESDKF